MTKIGHFKIICLFCGVVRGHSWAFVGVQWLGSLIGAFVLSKTLRNYIELGYDRLRKGFGAKTSVFAIK